MKRIIILISAVLVGLSSCTYDDSALVGRVENLEDRVTKLEKLCKEMNANIDAMAAIIEALETHDYITSVTPITKDGETVGYTITFAKGEPITIYHGEDGKDGVDGENGADGKDGKDGYTPVIGVEQDGDGIYYWTLDGEWLLDDAGNKIKAVGVDGKDGQDGQDGANGSDGEDGENGADGKDGVDGITPQLKIENEYWYISYDNGTTWTQLGKATGEDGANGSDGADGADGKDGDSFFEGVDTSNNDYVVFTLADGTTIKIPTWYAFEQLKKQCEEMNQNISSLQTIVEALQNNDYVTSVQQIVEDGKTIGYTINFSKSGAVTIYHGEDGKDGADGTDGVNGADGKDGHSPIVGVRQDSDGIYYWTLDGEWLLDDAGNKIKAVGVDGKDGQDGQDGENGSDGEDGENGADGKDGVDGITPQLKIENEYWYISYDNGATWSQLGKATGEDGQDGANGSDGADGKDGDAFFESVDTSDKNYVVLTLIDGTTIQIPTWYAFEQLQALCNQMNTNISSLQTIVEALQNNDYVTSVTPVLEGGKTIGYTINFSKSGAVTIYHGENGKDGADGLDGHSPQIGVKQHTDGIYYWTLDGEWLLDDAGNKIKAVGVDGKDGQDGADGENGSDGEDGENGADGKDGVDGITPQLKIENEYWYISYDNGSTWTQLGKATGEDGQDGQDGANGSDGADGKDGDAFFESVDTSDKNYVVLTLIDGTTIQIPTWYAFEQLQALCNQMNTNISSLQTIVEALQNNDYVTSVTPVLEGGKTVGYTINFSKSGAVTIYHGENGKDGADGLDGHSPQIGVKQHTDGIYYWTLDGEWLKDANGNKIKAVGIDGANGSNGTNGVDGITPQLKIENDYWYISYDNGTTWSQLGKATGEDGANGSDGADGKDGDAFFESVDTSDKNYVVLTLIDGTTIQIPTWYAFEQLQALCHQMNTNISSLQTIVEALQNNDYVTSVTPVLEGGKTVGYTINFSKSGAVTIYHGENGKDGANGADGLDGHSPQIGVKQHTDGIYYWTLDGEWLKDANGNKIKAVGIDGANGSNGANGVDGITPQLKIENEYWYISYDNGSTWTQLGKATGEDGQDGANGSDGADGEDGDAFFESVDTSDKNYIVLTLIDGTTIQIPTWYAFEQLQALCNQMNTNISSLQTIVEALQNNDYVTSVTPIVDGGKTIGYTINFSKSGAVTIYHGEDGEDGANGENGLDGHSPQIGVKQHTDGIYYWTLDGEWLKDANGNKIKAVGIDGANGSNGTNGVDGITPQLKIENDYWYISYDNGTTWTQLGKATGEDGQDGANGSDGADGKDGDAFFESVDTSDKNYVILTLIDGTTIQIPTWYAFEQLQALCNQMNTNISSLQTIVEALQNNDYVTSVTPVVDGGKTIGYTINFSKSGAVTIYHGENGKDGADGLDGHSPQIGVKQHTDGIYYWTLDGEWLTDAKGNKIKAVGIDGANGSNGANGVDGITPQLKIENDYWYISYDNGTTWTQLGKATGEDGEDGEDGKDGDSFFQSVTQDEQYVYFTLADGTQITLPKGALLSISFDASDLVVMAPNSTREIGYSVQSVTESVTVEVTSSSDLRAKVVPASADGKSGNIVVTSSGVVDEYSKVIVFVSNGEKVVMKSIGFEQAGITISNGAEQTIGAEGGRVNLNFASNIDWKVAIPAEAQSWVQLAPQRSAMTEYSVALSVAPNTNLGTRSATVQVMTKDGKIAVDYTITQSTFTAVTATNANGWNAGDALAVFAGNTCNQQFKYVGAAGATSGTFEAVTVASGSAAVASAHYAVYPYKSSYRLSNGAISMTLPNSQSYVAGGYSSALDVMVGVSNGVADTNIALQPLCAYVCVKLWGAEQTIKSVTLASKGGEALAGNASVTPKYGAAPECVFTTKPSSTISMTCTELTLGTAEASATEFWFVVPPVALASGYSIKVAGFYGGEQTIDFPATTFASGAIYNIGAEVTVSTNGPGMGVGGWGDGENVDGEI